MANTIINGARQFGVSNNPRSCYNTYDRSLTYGTRGNAFCNGFPAFGFIRIHMRPLTKLGVGCSNARGFQCGF
jgi:hypothetical protein